MPISSKLPSVEELERLDLEGLRTLWAHYVGPVPKCRSVELLRQILAWRVQLAHEGGLDAELRRKLMRPGRGGAPDVRAGTRIVKVWQGRRFEVLIDETGPMFEGRRYRSLSEVARTITGTRWNGPRFFGLRDKEIAA